jgi:hypothetical protein
MAEQRGLFEKFVDSPYYSETEIVEVRWRFLFEVSPLETLHLLLEKRKRSSKVSPRAFQTALVVAPPS